MSNRIALILGSGVGVGAHVASRLLSEGYRVATVSRSSKKTKNNRENTIALEGDLADPTAVEAVFLNGARSVGRAECRRLQWYAPQDHGSLALQVVMAMLTSSASIRGHQWQDPRDSSRHPDRGISAASCRQHDIRLRRSARSTERLQETGPRQLLLHGQLPCLEPHS